MVGCGLWAKAVTASSSEHQLRNPRQGHGGINVKLCRTSPGSPAAKPLSAPPRRQFRFSRLLFSVSPVDSANSSGCFTFCVFVGFLFFSLFCFLAPFGFQLWCPLPVAAAVWRPYISSRFFSLYFSFFLSFVFFFPPQKPESEQGRRTSLEKFTRSVVSSVGFLPASFLFSAVVVSSLVVVLLGGGREPSAFPLPPTPLYFCKCLQVDFA